MIKKVMTFMLSICITLGLINIASASEPMIIKLESKTIKEGEQFNVNISITNNPGIAGFTLKIGFDKNLITPVSFKNNSNFTALTTIDSSDVDLTSIDTINVTYDSLDNISDNGIIGTITFTAKKNIGADTINIDWITDQNSSVYNKDLEDIFFKAEGAVLTVEKENIGASDIYGDSDNDGHLTANDASLILKKVLDGSKTMPIEKATKEYMKYIDVDGNRILTARDAALVLQKALDSNFKFPIE